MGTHRYKQKKGWGINVLAQYPWNYGWGNSHKNDDYHPSPNGWEYLGA